MNVHILFRRIEERRRFVRPCPTCKVRRRMVGELERLFGWVLVCCTCGERWEEGCEGFERSPRPFERGWRRRQAAEAQARWAACTSRS